MIEIWITQTSDYNYTIVSGIGVLDKVILNSCTWNSRPASLLRSQLTAPENHNSRASNERSLSSHTKLSSTESC